LDALDKGYQWRKGIDSEYFEVESMAALEDHGLPLMYRIDQGSVCPLRYSRIRISVVDFKSIMSGDLSVQPWKITI